MRTLAFTVVVIVVALGARAEVPSGWIDPQRLTITGQGDPYDGSYELPWSDGLGAFQYVGAGLAATVTPGEDGAGVASFGWSGVGVASFGSADFGASWSHSGGNFAWDEGGSLSRSPDVPEGGMTASVGSLFDLVVSSALSAVTLPVVLVITMSVMLLLIGLLCVVVRRRLGLLAGGSLVQSRPAGCVRRPGLFKLSVGKKRGPARKR